MNATEITNTLSGFYGTERYHKLTIFPGMVATDGVAYLAKAAQCFWLTDEITAGQRHPKIRGNRNLQDMQFWELKVTDRSAVLTCSEDENKPVYTKKIPYTNFPLQSIRVWVAPYDEAGNKVMMLPTEY